MASASPSRAASGTDCGEAGEAGSWWVGQMFYGAGDVHIGISIICLVVEPTHFKHMLVKLDHFPKDPG